MEIEVEMPVGDGHNEGRGAMSELALLMVWPQAVFNDDYLSATSRNALLVIAHILAAICLQIPRSQK